jgi:hypothetical protein
MELQPTLALELELTLELAPALAVPMVAAGGLALELMLVLGRVKLCSWRRRTARVPALAPSVPEGSRRGLPALAPHGRRWRWRRRRGWGRALPRWHRPRLYLIVFARQGGFRRALLALHDGLCSAALFLGSAVRARVSGSLVTFRSPLARSLPPAWVSSS